MFCLLLLSLCLYFSNDKQNKERKEERNKPITHTGRGLSHFFYMFHYLIKGTEKLDGGVGEGDNKKFNCIC